MIPSCPSFIAAANRSRPCVSTASESATGAALKSVYNLFEPAAPLDE